MQIYKKDVLLTHILNVVNKTNLTDYTMDIVNRLNPGSVVPEELAARKAKVLVTLTELQNEVAPITYANDKLKDTDHMKDSKTFLNILQKEYGVSAWKKWFGVVHSPIDSNSFCFTVQERVDC